MIIITIDKSSGAAAYYLQIAQQIADAVQQGQYLPGDRLPTEQDMLRQTGLSPGTVKAAYNYLQKCGVVRKVRGSGVYVQEHNEDIQSPQKIVDDLFDTLTFTHGLSVADAHHLIKDIVTEMFDDDPLHVVVVDCNPETIHVIEKQLEQIPGIHVDAMLLDVFVRHGDEELDPQCELVLTTHLHQHVVCRYTSQIGLRTEPFALLESKETLVMLSKLPENERVCVVYRSEKFLASVWYTLCLTKRQNRMIPCLEGDNEKLERYCHSGLPFLLPPDYLTHCSNRTLQYVYRARAAGSVIIPMVFEIDRGSILHIAELVKSIKAQHRRQLL